ncbi:MAG: bacteriohemerythrin [Sulfuricella sp.]
MDMTAGVEKFEAFAWNDKFRTGIETVDSQHHKLVDLINRLGAISMRQAGTEELGGILTELANYTVYHFDTEEKLMLERHVSAAHQDAHIKAHHHFTAQVGVAAQILLRATDVTHQLVAPLLEYLTRWLVHHILGQDTRMAQEIMALEAGAGAEEAVRKANAYMTQSANVLMEALNEMYGKLGDKTLEVMQKNQELEEERSALEERVKQRTQDLERLNEQLLAYSLEQQELNEKLENAHTQLLQSEKMASIGQLAAGVAHEINNPVGFVNSNLGTLEKYMADLFTMIAAYEQAEKKVGGQLCPEVAQVKKTVDLSYLKEDIPNLVKESREGLTRVKQIIQDLKDFSHVDESTWQLADVEKGMDSTLNVVTNEIKYKAEVVKEYGGLPEVECMPSQINQVFMNLLVNAAQAIEEQGVITIRSGRSGDEVWMEVADTGKGIAPELINRIFDPFFTTKPVGKGTGLGLSLSYGIVQKHGGRIEVKSEVGKGTAMRVWLPLRQSEGEGA